LFLVFPLLFCIPAVAIFPSAVAIPNITGVFTFVGFPTFVNIYMYSLVLKRAMISQPPTKGLLLPVAIN
jgi:hypothetical protein